jgi:hypothetical protein
VLFVDPVIFFFLPMICLSFSAAHLLGAHLWVHGWWRTDEFYSMGEDIYTVYFTPTFIEAYLAYL